MHGGVRFHAESGKYKETLIKFYPDPHILNAIRVLLLTTHSIDRHTVMR